jgi:AcrR family transcriptional regulator
MMSNYHKKERETVLNTGRILFRTYGFRRTTYNLIADEANVSRYVLRRYFPLKKEIFRNLFEDEKDKVRKRLKKLINTTDFSDRSSVSGTFRSLCRQIENSSFLRMIYMFGDFPVQYCLRESHGHNVDSLTGPASILEKFLIQCQKEKTIRSGDTVVLADAFRNIFHILLQKRSDHARLKKEDRIMIDIFVDGMMLKK